MRVARRGPIDADATNDPGWSHCWAFWPLGVNIGSAGLTRTAGKPCCLLWAIVGGLAAGMALAEETTPGETPGAIVIHLDRVGRPRVQEMPSARPPLSGARRRTVSTTMRFKWRPEWSTLCLRR
jgi:hypothetical protein